MIRFRRGGRLRSAVALLLACVACLGMLPAQVSAEAGHFQVGLRRTVRAAPAECPLYVYETGISSTDGTEPFDTAVGMKETGGFDHDGSNGICRTFDTIMYEVQAKYRLRTGRESATPDSAVLCFEVMLPHDVTEAVYDPAAFDSFQERGYTLSYYDINGELVAEGDQSMTDEDLGVLARSNAGQVIGTFDRNTLAGNPGTGEDARNPDYPDNAPYKTIVKKQVLRGSCTITSADGASVTAGERAVSIGIRILNMYDGQAVKPEIRFWFEGNEDNFESDAGTACAANILDIPAATVSAGDFYNLQLQRNTHCDVLGWFDFTTGDLASDEDAARLEELSALEENRAKADPAQFAGATDEERVRFGNIRYGRLLGYAVTFQLAAPGGPYGGTGSWPAGPDRGMRGMCYPTGDISYDLELVPAPGMGEEGFDAVLWEYDENVKGLGRQVQIPDRVLITYHDDPERGNAGRRQFFGDSRGRCGTSCGPGNFKQVTSGAEAPRYCYNGGFYGISGGLPPEASGESYSVIMTDYDFDMGCLGGGGAFPDRDLGGTVPNSKYAEYEKCVSCGYFQVLGTFPRHTERTAPFKFSARVGNLRVNGREAGKEVDPVNGDMMIAYDDNVAAASVAVYNAGAISSRGNVFFGAGGQWFGSYDYWVAGYDAAALPGTEARIQGRMNFNMRDSTSTASNLLQLFDRRFEINESRNFPCRCIRKDGSGYELTDGQGGTVRILYAADPRCPEGYDTCDTAIPYPGKDGSLVGIQEYMSGIREEDLVYFTSLDELEAAGYACVGVLWEVRRFLMDRNVDYLTCDIPVRLALDAPVGSVISVVNTARMWQGALGDKDSDGYKMAGVSWADGTYDPKTGRNSVEGYVTPSSRSENNRKYVKTEYKDNYQVPGTHAPNYGYGNSLLVVDYTSRVGVSCGGPAGISLKSREQSVEYVINDIEAKSNGPAAPDFADLRIELVLDPELEVNAKEKNNKRLITDAGGSRRKNDTGRLTLMQERGFYLSWKGEDGGEETALISSKPSEIRYYDFDAKAYRTVTAYYAAKDGLSVDFYLEDAPVNAVLPDIRFTAVLCNGVSGLDPDGATDIPVFVGISGDGDGRHYDTEVKYNAAVAYIHVTREKSAYMYGAASGKAIELGGDIDFTAGYVNELRTDKKDVLFYDVLPYRDDGRSDYAGTLRLRSLAYDGGAADGCRVWYATADPAELEGWLSGCNKQDLLDAILDGTGPYAFTEIDVSNPYTLPDGETATAVVAYCPVVAGNSDCTLKMHAGTSGNAAGDVYVNVPRIYLNGDGEATPANSSAVHVVSRAVSGRIWADQDRDGVRSVGEDGLGVEGVACALYGWNENAGAYEKLSETVSGPDGGYSFDGLRPGRYVVWLGDIPDGPYDGETAYQANGRNDDATSDGVRYEGGLPGIPAGGYIIQYRPDDPAVYFGGAEDVFAGNPDTCIESIADQDLGLLTCGMELPKTGGAGTGRYMAAGASTALLAGLLLAIRKKGRRETGK